MGGLSLREDWLARTQEPILEPDRRIVDPHFHFFVENETFPSYRLEDLQRDTRGHDVEYAVYMECEEGYRKGGAEHLQPVGETEWVDGLARAAEQSTSSLRIAGVIGDARLYTGSIAGETLDAHLAASSLFCGVRDMGLWDPSPEIDRVEAASNLDLYGEAAFRAGFAEVAKRGLAFDGHQYHTQLPHLAALARAFPDTPIVVDHLGSSLGAGPYAGKQDEIFPVWQENLRLVAECPNAFVKLGGLAMPWCGFGWEKRADPPTSDAFVATYRRYYEHAIDVFGPSRCMFESNFPVDKLSLSYDVLWNAFKKLAAGYSEDEKEAMFRGTAIRVYRLGID